MECYGLSAAAEWDNNCECDNNIKLAGEDAIRAREKRMKKRIENAPSKKGGVGGHMTIRTLLL